MDTQKVANLAIKKIQGEGLYSPYAGRVVCTNGQVTGLLRRGFFMQTPSVMWDGKASDALFVYSPDWQATVGQTVEVIGEVIDYVREENSKPVTQLHMQKMRSLPNVDANAKADQITPIEFDQDFLSHDNAGLANLLNSLEGMLVMIKAGHTFIAPSNPFGDYVLALDADKQDPTMQRTENNGVLVDPENHLRWFAGFRLKKYNHAPRLNVGAKLLSDIQGPLNYRVEAYQISIDMPFKVEPAFVNLTKSTLHPSAGSVTIMTLNCFNLDPHIESAERVMNPRQDVDDDWGDGRFHTLAQATVLQANSPDIIALQEIQDNDGAEMTDVVDASDTYALLIKTIKEISGIEYAWVDVEPDNGADGGQPGGNIRNAYLYNPERVCLVDGSVSVFATDDDCFENSRKPLLAQFKELSSGKVIACINLHLASKRHQNSIFAPTDPGHDAKLPVRVEQAQKVADKMQELHSQGLQYYVTGDFNDTEYSQTLSTLLGHHSHNLVADLPPIERYDYNHRGKLQVLMHGVVSKKMAANGTEYEIIHGNELIGVSPGELSDKPSDHAYVIAKLALQ